MTQNETTAPQYDPYQLDWMMLARLAVVGILTGVVGWLLYLGIAQYFIQPVFCKDAATFSVCRNGGTIAWVTAHIIVMAVAVAVLAKLAVYRPLLVVLAALIALWSAHAWLGGLDWYAGLGWQAVLFAVAFMIFGWVARITNFAIAATVAALLAIGFRVVLMYA